MSNIFENKKTLTRIQERKSKFGNVFIVNDKLFNHKGAGKPRRVVLIGKKAPYLLLLLDVRHIHLWKYHILW